MNSITLKPEINELYILNEFVFNELGKKNLQVRLILEEVFVNIVDYSKTDFIIVNAKFDKTTLTLEFIDNGIEFNPLLEKDPEMPDNINDAQIGGLGIFLTKQIADGLNYSYVNGENHLRIIKKVK